MKITSTWRNVVVDTRPRIGDTPLPPVDARLTRAGVRRMPWVAGSVDDAIALPSRGWVVGHFDGVAEPSRHCQVKLWAFTGELGDSYPWKRLRATEIDFVYAGSLNLALRKRAGAVVEYVSVRAGNWIVVRPGVLYRAMSGDHAAGVTVRWPSKRGGKAVVK